MRNFSSIIKFIYNIFHPKEYIHPSIYYNFPIPGKKYYSKSSYSSFQDPTTGRTKYIYIRWSLGYGWEIWLIDTIPGTTKWVSRKSWVPIVPDRYYFRYEEYFLKEFIEKYLNN